jgi:aryl-alcohol dehydrogenase-like predicted oxidoreductase
VLSYRVPAHSATQIRKDSLLRTLGSTSLIVSTLGLGLAALGRPGYINLGHGNDLGHVYDLKLMEQQAHTVLDAAWQAGIRYFDAARSYGRAEEFLGSWLRTRQIAPESITVGSKWGYIYTAGWQVQAEQHEVKDHSLPVLQQQWQESQLHLAPYLRIYQVHSATLESGILTNQSVLARLQELKEEGVTIGLSLSGPNQAAVLEQALELRVEGARIFDAVQATWNLLESSAGAALQMAHAAGMGVIVKEALANGRLTLRNTDPGFVPQWMLLAQQAARLQTTVDALALAAVLAQPWVDVVLSGATTVEQLQSNVAAPYVAWDAEAAAALAILAESPSVYWRTRSQLAWN